VKADGGTGVPAAPERAAIWVSMKLLNFQLSEPSFAIELLGLGFVWDLHNSGDFVGLTINANDNCAVMTWNVGGHPSAMYSGCNLIFRGLKQVMVTPRDEELPLSQDTCVSGISKVIPDRTQIPECRVKHQWDEDEPFHLFIGFQSRRSIEIDAESVELVGLRGEKA
jgi:hypothetical protein